MAISRVLIVGANGFLGSRAVRAALDAGYVVHTFGPEPVVDVLAPWRCRIAEHQGSITDPEATATAVQDARPDVVLSFAAYGEGYQGLMRSSEKSAGAAFAVNVEGFRQLLATCVDTGIHRVIWASSTTVFGTADEYSGAADEQAPRLPRTIYGLSKLLAEEVALYFRRQTGLGACAVRPPLVFGPGRWYAGAGESLDRLLSAAVERRPVRLSVPADRFDLMHGDDVAAAFLHLARYDGPLSPCYHVNGFSTSYAEIVELLASWNEGFRPDVTFTASSTRYPLISSALIEAETGFRSRFDLAGALHQTLQEMGK